MMSNIEVVSFIVFSLIHLFFLVRSIVWSKAKWSAENVYSWLFHLSIIILSVHKIYPLTKIWPSKYLEHLDMALISMAFSLVPAIILAHQGVGHRLKRRISSRIPMIAFLAALYLGPIAHFLNGAILILSFFLLKGGENNLFVRKSLIWLTIFSALGFGLMIPFQAGHHAIIYLVIPMFYMVSFFSTRILSGYVFAQIFKS